MNEPGPTPKRFSTPAAHRPGQCWPPTQGDANICRYLELLKKSILNEIYLTDEERIYFLRQCISGQDEYDYVVLHDISTHRPETHQEYLRSRAVGQFPYRDIRNSSFQHSMIGRARMNNLHQCLDMITADSIVGDLIECGVWRGGATIFMQGYLQAHAINDRRVFVADSFEGLTDPEVAGDPDLSPDVYPQLAVRLEDVVSNFQAYDLWCDNVVPLKGWFCDTLPNASIESLALLRADGDLYSSTMDILDSLYDKVSDGGIVIIDDYGVLPNCARAVLEFFEKRNSDPPKLREIDWSGVYWRK